jgi:2-(1,2-epoxy-1,2-dihydrophenyl)acetyl-CoA isomerase
MLLLGAAVGDQRRPEHAKADEVEHAGQAGPLQLLRDDYLLDRAEAESAELRRPADAGQSAIGEHLLPGAPLRDILAVGRPAAVLAQEGPDSFSEFRLGGVVVEVHSHNINRPDALSSNRVVSMQSLTLEVRDAIAELRLTRPDTRNAIDPAMIAALEEAAAALERLEGVRAVLICAEGPTFTVGGDLGHFKANLDRLPEELDAMVGRLHVALATLGRLDVPIVAAAAGAIAGGGLGLLWCADVVLLADDAKLAAAFARIGLSGDGGSTWALPRLVGLRRAQEFLIGGRVLSADEAVEWGMATRVLPAAELQAAARSEARRLAAGPTVAFGHMRRLLRDSSLATWPEQLAAEREAMTASGASADAREGVTSFSERRDPVFDGH